MLKYLHIRWLDWIKRDWFNQKENKKAIPFGNSFFAGMGR
jgi:hypothetical protein